MSAGALAGIRVLDFSAMIAGPYCTSLLASLGAEVIKVEPPEGDYMRSRPPLREGQSLYFAVLNAGKQSLAVDLKRPEGVALVKSIVARADVVVENFRPGVMRRLGLDHASLAAIRPELVYCSISGYGQDGASASLPAYAPIVHAASGFDLVNLAYQSGADRPLNTGIFIADFLTGVHAFGAINAALVRRARDGQGSLIDCALMDAMVGMLAYEVAEAQQPEPNPRLLYKATRAKDGFFMLSPISPANFEAMARACGHPEWITDPRFAGSARIRNWDALLAELDDWAADKTVAECQAIMDAGGVPCARYQSVPEVMASPYAQARGLFADAHIGGVAFKAPNPPFRMAGEGCGHRVPGLGEDSRRIASEMAGFSEAQVARAMEQQILYG